MILCLAATGTARAGEPPLGSLGPLALSHQLRADDATEDGDGNTVRIRNVTTYPTSEPGAGPDWSDDEGLSEWERLRKEWPDARRGQYTGKLELSRLRWLDAPTAIHTPPTWGDYRARVYGTADTLGQAYELGMVQHDLLARMGFISMGSLGAGVRIRALDLRSRPRLPGTGQRMPDSLTRVEVELLGAVFNLGADVAIGSASDRPFFSGDEMTVDVTMGSIIAMAGPIAYVNWNNNRDFLNGLPIVGVGWGVHEKDDGLNLIAGFPDSAVTWRATERLTLSGSYAFPRTIYTRVAYRPIEAVELFAGFEWDNQRYFRHDRRDRNDRLWYVEKRVMGGVRWDITAHCFLEAIGGYAFDRFWFEGHTYEDRFDSRIGIGDGPFVSLQLGVRFQRAMRRGHGGRAVPAAARGVMRPAARRSGEANGQ